MGTELIPQDGDTIICLKVGKIDREDLYEMTRKYWKMSLQRASKANHVLAVVDGIVKEDYIPQDWKYTDNPKYEGRIEFVGNKCLNSPYVGKNVVSFYENGHAACPSWATCLPQLGRICVRRLPNKFMS